MTDVTDNFEQFAAALRVLVPLFERGGIRWHDEDQYDEFYEIADALFHGFVTSNFSDNPNYIDIFASYKYDMSGMNAGKVSFIVCDAVNNEEFGKFEKFVTVDLPFDSIQFDISGQKKITKLDLNKTRIIERLP